MFRAAILLSLIIGCDLARAQDVPGIETCTRETKMECRTGCLQSNIEFLHQALRKNTLETQQKLAAMNTEIVTLKAALAELRSGLAQLQAQKPETPKPAAK